MSRFSIYETFLDNEMSTLIELTKSLSGGVTISKYGNSERNPNGEFDGGEWGRYGTACRSILRKEDCVSTILVSIRSEESDFSSRKQLDDLGA